MPPLCDINKHYIHKNLDFISFVLPSTCDEMPYVNENAELLQLDEILILIWEVAMYIDLTTI